MGKFWCRMNKWPSEPISGSHRHPHLAILSCILVNGLKHPRYFLCFLSFLLTPDPNCAPFTSSPPFLFAITSAHKRVRACRWLISGDSLCPGLTCKSRAAARGHGDYMRGRLFGAIISFCSEAAGIRGRISFTRFLFELHPLLGSTRNTQSTLLGLSIYIPELLPNLPIKRINMKNVYSFPPKHAWECLL